ncbi:MAG: transcription antitermination factor NusB [Pseudomonadota bacterium]
MSASGLVARRAALDLLDSVLRRARPLDQALARSSAFAALEPRDRAFARHLVATALRRLGQIDGLLAACLEKPVKARQSRLEDLLRLGACQLAFLRTPPHAAVSTTMALAGENRLTGAKSLINAVLRRLSREAETLLAAQDAARLNTPDWLWNSWIGAYGEDTARQIAEAHLAEPPLDITVQGKRDLLVKRLGALELPSGSLRLPGGQRDVTRLPGYAEGQWWVQDGAAAWPAQLFGDVSGRQVIDLCAAPGGKTAQLAAAGAQVTAVERAKERLGQLTENLTRLGLSARTVIADGTFWRPETLADGVLLDAPCTATGTLRRHPDIAHLKSARDVAAVARAQDRLLAAALEMVRPGGLLVYATCSLQPEEGPERIAALLAAGAPVERVPVSAEELGGLSAAVTAEGDLRTLPCHLADQGGLDGFYACRLRRL